MTAPVVVCSWGAVNDALEETLALGSKAAAALGADLDWLVLGPLPQGAASAGARYGIAHIDHAAGPALSEFRPDPYVAALAGYCERAATRLLAFSQTYDARLIAPRVAGRLNAGIVMNAIDVEAGGGGLLVTATSYGGDARSVYALVGDGPHVIAVTAADAGEASAGAEPPVREVSLDVGGVDERITIERRASSEGPRLEDAKTIVAGGRGLGAAEHYRLIDDLAKALGGMPAASRAIVDDGWADASRQIGLTGKIAKPGLYIAAGISGASQHMAGCSSSKVIVAINRDPDAAIFRYARYGIVGDCREVLAALIDAARPPAG